MAEECLFVTDGAITVDCLDETFLLEQGDSIYIRSNTPHNIYNHTERTATAIFCTTPPVL
jgi:mannose-6-phosphate isomerase-like protein (cupin superfamily)